MMKSLEDVIEKWIDEPDCEFLIEDYLDQMPNTRASAEEMLDAIVSYDLLPVYQKLLLDCEDLLTPQELQKVKKDFKRLFSVPLQGEEA